MKTILKITYLIVLFVTFSGCISKPRINIVATARLMNSENMPETLIALEKRMAKFQVSSVITKINETDILMDLTTFIDPEVLNEKLFLSTKLEFYEVVPADFIHRKMYEYSKEENLKTDIVTKVIPNVNPGNPIVGSVKTQDTLEVSTFIKNSSLIDTYKLPNNNLKFKWGIKDKKGLHPLYLLITDTQGIPEMSGDLIESAMQGYDQLNEPTVSIEMNKNAAKKWELFTARAAKEQFQIAIVLDGIVYSAPGVMGAISGGKSTISGDFTVEEARRVAAILEIGYLPKIEMLSFDVIKDKN